MPLIYSIIKLFGEFILRHTERRGIAEHGYT